MEGSRHHSITAKLLFIYVPLLCVALLTVFALIIYQNYKSERIGIIQELNRVAVLRSSALSSRLWEFNIEEVAVLVSQLAEVPHLSSAAVYDNFGELVAQIGQFDPLVEDSELKIEQELIATTALGIESIGSFIMVFNTDRAREEIYNDLVSGLIVLVALVLTLIVVTLVAVRHVIGRPLNKLLYSIDRMRTEGVLEHVEWHSGDELGRIIYAYNEMQKKQAASEERLEETVEQRTKELQLAKEKSESSSRITQSTIDNMDQGILMVDGEGNLLVYNNVLMEYLHISTEQAESMQTVEEFRSLGSKVFSEEVVQQSADIAREGGVAAYDVTTLDGKTLDVRQNSIAGGGYVRTYSDITERKKAETALIEQSALVKLLRTTASDANSAINFHEAVHTCLATVSKHTGWPVGHAYFLSEEDESVLVSSGIWHLEDPKRFAAFVETTKKTTFKPGIGLPGRVLENGEPAWIVDVSKDPNFRAKLAEEINVRGAFAFPVLSRDKVVGVLEFFDDKPEELDESLLVTVAHIGGQLGRVFERDQAEESLRISAEKAEAATQSKSSFLAAMSHEIRTPMNGVVGMVDLLQQTEMETDQRSMLRTVRDSAFALLGIINDILDFSKIEAGKLELEIIPLSIRDVIEGVAQTLLPTSNKKGVRLLIYIDPEIPAWVMGDSVRLRQIILNLAGNAIKFTESHNGEPDVVTIRADRVKPKSKNKINLQFSVTDTGIGMSPEGVERLFKPFSQTDSSTTRRFGGTGLGLSICKNLTDLMKGEIGVSSEEGKGSTFTLNVSLPPTKVERSDVEETDLFGLRILLAIKQQATLNFTSRYLEHSRIEISSTEELSEVPDLLKSAKQAGTAFDILILGSTWDEGQREELIDSLHKDTKELRYLILTDDQTVKKGLVLPDTMVVQHSPLLRSAFILGVGVVAGRASPDLAEDAPELLLKPRKSLTVEEAEALGQLVLVAEDNLTNQDVIRRQLNLLGYTAEIAFDGKEAFELWQSKNYGLLLSDVHMPEMDGYELTAAIRKIETDSDKRIPIVAITANALQGEADKCLQAGMDDYLAKPLEMDKLKRMLSKWLPLSKNGKSPSTNKAKQNGGKGSTAEKLGDEKAASVAAIDTSVLASVFGDDADTIYEILKDFVDPATDNVQEIEAAYTKRSAEGVQAAAHKLKSSARAVGANALADVCSVLEQAGKENKRQDIEREVPKLAGKLGDVLAYIKDL